MRQVRLTRSVRGRRAVLAIAGVVVASTVGVATAGTEAAATTSAVTPSVTCQVARLGATTIWFGYRNDALNRITLPVGPTNTVAVSTGSLANDHGQVEQFIQGSTSFAFGVTVPTGNTASWTLTAPELDANGNTTQNSVTVSAVSSSATPACPAGTSARSASVRLAGGQLPRLRTTAVAELRNQNGLLVFSTVRLSLDGVASRCSHGGIPLSPTVLWGYGGPSQIFGGSLLRSAGAAYAPVASALVTRTDVLNGATFVRTRSPFRQVVDPQRLFLFGSVQQQATGQGITSRGLSSEAVIADVTARCLFGLSIVSSSVDYWFDADGRPITVMTATDQALQTTRPAVACSLAGPIPTPCDVEIIGVGPGTPKVR